MSAYLNTIYKPLFSITLYFAKAVYIIGYVWHKGKIKTLQHLGNKVSEGQLEDISALKGGGRVGNRKH